MTGEVSEMGRYWRNRLARADETEAILRLVRAVHGDAYQELNREYWRWRYLNGTQFAADIVMADDAGTALGIQPAALFDWQWGERRLKGVMYTGVLTHPKHRRQGIFRTLIDSANELAVERGAQFVITMPNDASLPGFLKFGGWRYPGLIPVWIKVLDGKALLSPKLGMAAGWVGWMPGLFFCSEGSGAALRQGLPTQMCPKPRRSSTKCLKALGGTWVV
jgi:GNAT superfamily N-acetyltransferase